MNNLEHTVEVAKGISDFGMMAVTAAFFLILSGIMMVFFMRWLVKVINGILDRQNTTMDKLLEESRKQNESLIDIREGLIDETLTRIKTISSFAFDLSVEQVCRIIKRIRTENNISDKEATQNKIKMLLQNLHDDRNSKFDNFTFSGKRLSQYTSPKWVEDISKVVENEVYSKENNGRTNTNVRMAYETVKIEFYRNLRFK